MTKTTFPSLSAILKADAQFSEITQRKLLKIKLSIESNQYILTKTRAKQAKQSLTITECRLARILQAELSCLELEYRQLLSALEPSSK